MGLPELVLPDGRRPVRRLAAAALVIAMSLVAFALWTVVPLSWIWVASQTQRTSSPSMGAYVMIIIGIPVTIGFAAKLLAVLSDRHADLTGRGPDGRRPQAAWLRSMRGERDSGLRVGVLEGILIATACVAVMATAVWFFGFAGSSLPNA